MSDSSQRVPSNRDLPPATVCAVIVTYFPDSGLLQELLASIAGQVEAVVIVDNTPSPGAPGLEAMLAATHPLASHTIRFGNNRGIAAAQNAGIAWAIERGYGYVLLLDHDSVPDAGMAGKLRDVAEHLLANDVTLAAVGPRYVNPASGRMARIQQIGALRVRLSSCPEQPADAVVRCDVLISSGTLIPVRSIEAIGNLEESLFIDGVDHEWCLRARGRGYSCHIACGAVMRHHLGAGVVRYWFGRWRHAPVHSPARHYYMLRNALLVCRRPYVPFAWTMHQLTNTVALIAVSLLFLPQRLNRLVNSLRAIWHGMSGRSGPL